MDICRRIDVRSAEKESHTEYHLTGAAGHKAITAESSAALFSEAAAVLAEKGIQPIQEKVYGLAEAREEILAVREEAFLRHGLDPSLPVTYIDGRPVSGSQFAGLQIWGVSPKGQQGASVTTLEGIGSVPARCWTGPGFRMVYLPHVRGSAPEGTPPSCVTGQAKRMFSNVVEALKAHGFSYSQVVRTWIYLARILDWYGEFNRVRTEHHATQGLCQTAGDTVFPASTGIQGKCFEEEECFMDVLALESNGTVDVCPITESSRQPDAFSYGSGFSRAMALTIEGRTTVFISGTASINADGETVHLGDAELQSLETIMDIAALLEKKGGSISNICTATLFCKDVETYEAYRNVTRLLGLPEFPTVPVVADVCRRDLLLEIEAVAII